jgi:DNA-binding transcriptional ArsR family regulator
MLDQLRRDIKTRLDELLGEADKLRHALAELGSRDSSTPPPASTASPPARTQPRRGGSAPASRSATPKSARSRADATTAATAPSRQPAKTPAAKPASGRPKSSAARAASGATKSAILAALANDSAMTAGEIATATGLGRATVSSTLSRLAQTGEVTKAPRGYQITKPTSAPAAADATGSADSGVTAT